MSDPWTWRQRSVYGVMFVVLSFVALIVFLVASIWHALQNLWYRRPFKDEL